MWRQAISVYLALGNPLYALLYSPLLIDSCKLTVNVSKSVCAYISTRYIYVNYENVRATHVCEVKRQKRTRQGLWSCTHFMLELKIPRRFFFTTIRFAQLFAILSILNVI